MMKQCYICGGMNGYHAEFCSAGVSPGARSDLVLKCLDPDFAGYAPDPGKNTEERIVLFQVDNSAVSFHVYMPKDHPYVKGETYTFRAVCGGQS